MRFISVAASLDAGHLPLPLREIIIRLSASGIAPHDFVAWAVGSRLKNARTQSVVLRPAVSSLCLLLTISKDQKAELVCL